MVLFNDDLGAETHKTFSRCARKRKHWMVVKFKANRSCNIKKLRDLSDELCVSRWTTCRWHTQDNNSTYSRDDRFWAMSHERWHIHDSLSCPGLFPNETGSISSWRKHVKVMSINRKSTWTTERYLTSSFMEPWCISTSHAVHKLHR